MITLTQAQIELLTKSSQNNFINRVINIMQEDCPQLIKVHSKGDLFSLLTHALEEAKGLHILVEADVYKYMVLCVSRGLSFLDDTMFNSDSDWYSSLYVPSVIKIEKIQKTLLAKQFEEKL